MAYKVVYVARWYNEDNPNEYEDYDEAFDTEQEALDFCKEMGEEE